MAQEQINININEGEPFFAHEATVNFTPTQLTLDFKCITPRTDPRGKKPSFQLKHNVVMLDPWHAKSLLSVLNSVIQKYEQEFGKIKKPKSLEKAEKKQKEFMKKAGESVPEVPTYMG
ncbi:DUF3467 domain-containing protein [Candidatus Woesearchaeota archaeon]|nr:DUF3467 domain-containing protein [Candidatus Woesearchaeota archaeon]MBW3016173.1 DUF3467 domain-containing protein [Candidatus Woesearchaeota archaeon]